MATETKKVSVDKLLKAIETVKNQGYNEIKKANFAGFSEGIHEFTLTNEVEIEKIETSKNRKYLQIKVGTTCGNKIPLSPSQVQKFTNNDVVNFAGQILKVSLVKKTINFTDEDKEEKSFEILEASVILTGNTNVVKKQTTKKAAVLEEEEEEDFEV
jgi:hypothetical protein